VLLRLMEQSSGKHELPPGMSSRIVQPAVIADGEMLLNQGGRTSLRRIAVTHESNGWSVKEQWVSTGLKPHFSDFVIHDGHAFGFDNGILSCIELMNGERKWKGGKYGHGQFLLLADQDLLLILTEKGELALVNARTDQLRKLPAFRQSQEKHRIIPCWSATRCWFAMARKWPPFDLHWRTTEKTIFRTYFD